MGKQIIEPHWPLLLIATLAVWAMLLVMDFELPEYTDVRPISPGGLQA
jgi:hypothetical protein